jgi:hypothetical protein
MTSIRLIILFNLFSFISCGKGKEIVSPETLIHIIPYQDILSENSINDSITAFNGIKKTGEYWTIATYNGIYILDNSLSKTIKTFKFEIKKHFELFDGQDSIVGFHSIEIIPNSTNTKFLVLVGNGILFQIDCKTLSVDWLIKFKDRIETATYSEIGDKVAIGTRYNRIQEKKYYSTLYLLESGTGKFIKHLNESASVLKICFAKSDESLLVAYNWPSYDLWLWSIVDNKSELKLNNVGLHSDLEKINDTAFISASTSQIILWNIKSSETGKTLSNTNSINVEKISFNKELRKYICLITKPGPKGFQSYHFYIYDIDFQNPIFRNLNITVAKTQFDFNGSLIYFASEYPRDNKPTGIYSYNIETQEINLLIDRMFFKKIDDENRK